MIAYLEDKDKGVIDTVRNSQQKGRMFLQFIFDYLLGADPSWKDPISVDCSCGNSHEIIACGWIHTLTDRSWVPTPGRKNELPTAENIERLLDPMLLPQLAHDDDSALFLQRLKIGVSDLFRVKITDESERLQADRLAARMYAQDAEMRSLLTYVLDDPDFREFAQKHAKDRDVARRNREVGSLVELLIKQALEIEQISVHRTGIGSDYEIEYDFIEDGQEQVIVVGKYLLEVKSTKTDDVRMSLTQGSIASSPPPEYEGYILCVCPIAAERVTEEDIRSHARFMFDISGAVTQALSGGMNLEAMENTLKGTGGKGVHLEIGQSPKKLRVSRDAWTNGLDFDSAVDLLKVQISD